MRTAAVSSGARALPLQAVVLGTSARWAVNPGNVMALSYTRRLPSSCAGKAATRVINRVSRVAGCSDSPIEIRRQLCYQERELFRHVHPQELFLDHVCRAISE